MEIYEYVIVFVSTALLGMVITYLMHRFIFERKISGGVATGIRDYTYFLSLIVRKGVFKRSELEGIPEDKLEAMLRDAESSGLLISYGSEDKLYMVNYPALWDSLGEVFRHAGEVTRAVQDARDKIVVLGDEDYDKLADAGIKAIGVIYWDDVMGPYVKCLTAVTGLTARLMRDPALVVRIYTAGQESSMIEVEEGKLFLERFTISGGEREYIGLVFAEVASFMNEEEMREILRELAERAGRSGEAGAESLVAYLSQVLHGG